MSHTPGPWIVGEYGECHGYDCMTGGISIGPRGLGPVHLDGAQYGQKRCHKISAESLERMEADARLIAAAPELLMLVRHIVSNHEPEALNLLFGSGWADHAKQVLAKVDA